MSRIESNGTVRQNPLARFKSYSYYHALLICNSRETADAIASQTTDVIDTWLHPAGSVSNGKASDLGRYNPKSFGNDPRMQYCVLINGATDATFTITNLSFQTLAAANASNNDRFTSLAVEGKMEISEPKGVTFLDTIVRCCNMLGKDAAHVCFMVKTFFVGYNEQDKIETIVNVAPLTFLIVDATGSFTEAGGIYTLEFVAMQNGASRLPQFDKMLQMPPVKGKTLKDVVDTMQKSIDQSYEKMYSCIKQQVQKTHPEYVNALKKVKYKIELADLYQRSEYTFTSDHQQGSDRGTCDDKKQISTGTDMSLESALHQMMQHCHRVELDNKDGILQDIPIAGQTVKQGTRAQYRIHTSYMSYNDRPDFPYEMTYRIEPYPSPKSLLAKAASKRNDNSSEAIADRAIIDSNTIHFDYVYTGKNVDVLEFDMKVNMGLAYLQIASLKNTYKNQGESTQLNVTASNARAVVDAQNRTKAADNASVLVDIPVFFGTNLDLPSKRTSANPIATATMAYDMTKHSSVEVLDASMKVTGNLLLLHSTLVQTQMEGTSINTPRETVEDQKNMDWGYVPGFAKVHIRMPAHNDDISLFDSKDQSFTREFWYDYYYYIIGVEHVFNEGEFTQNLEMIGLPVPMDLKGEAPDQQKEKEVFSSEVTDCYTNATKDCSSTTGGAPDNTQQSENAQERKTVEESPAVQSNAPTLPAQPIDKIVSTMEPSNVKGWEKMDPAVKKATLNKTAGGPIPVSTYVAISAIESNGNPGAVSSTGAKGIFQFVKGTWNEVMPAHRITETSDPRTDAELNAEAARKYLERVSKSLGTTDPTWLYMGHNLGPGAAAAVKREASKGNCRPMRDVYAEHLEWGTWDTFAENNGYSAEATTCNLRNEIATKYQKRLKQVGETQQAPQQNPAAAGAQAAQAKVAPTVKPEPTPQATRPAAVAKNRTMQECKTAGGGNKESGNKTEKKPEVCGTDKEPAKTTQAKYHTVS